MTDHSSVTLVFHKTLEINSLGLRVIVEVFRVLGKLALREVVFSKKVIAARVPW